MASSSSDPCHSMETSNVSTQADSSETIEKIIQSLAFPIQHTSFQDALDVQEFFFETLLPDPVNHINASDDEIYSQFRRPELEPYSSKWLNLLLFGDVVTSPELWDALLYHVFVDTECLLAGKAEDVDMDDEPLAAA
ncbi:hypothetical protein H0H92_001714 [Tricholoma furcatifolium]|nr:hypothetical protein H0H92_001714 [Tricholoma furcatifolium]